MREILFRGKCEIEGKWVYGYYTEYCPDKKEWISVIETEGESFYVLPKTVGQYTGIKDKNGKKIFEGDIIKFDPLDDGDLLCYISFDDGAFRILYEDGNYDHNIVADSFISEYEVVGNIFDNPELLNKVGET